MLLLLEQLGHLWVHLHRFLTYLGPLKLLKVTFTYGFMRFKNVHFASLHPLKVTIYALCASSFPLT